MSHKNIMIRTDVPASVLALGARRENVHGVSVAILPKGVAIVFASPEDFEGELRRVVLPKTDPTLIPFLAPEWIPSSEEIRDFVRKGGRGVVTGSARGTAPVNGVGLPLHLAVARFLTIPRAIGLPELGSAPQLFKPRNDGNMIVPFLGELHVGGQALTDEQLERCGISYLRDSGGEKLEHAVLLSGNRSIFFPTYKGIGGQCELPQSVPLGWQFKGTGVRRYAFHTVMADRQGKPIFRHSDEVMLVGDDTDYIPHGMPCQRPVYAGKAGVFADLRHQPASDVPVGGEGNWSDTVNTQVELARFGVPVARAVTDVGSLLRKEALDTVVGPNEMSVPELFVSCETWFADGGTTMRLDAVTSQFRVCEEDISKPLPQARAVFDELLAAEVGTVSAEARQAKIRRLSSQIGSVVRGGLESGRTLYVDRNSDDNLTWNGVPLDYGDFHVAAGWWQLGSLVFRCAYDLQRIALCARIDTVNFFAEGFGELFLKEFLAENEAQGVAAMSASRFRKGSRVLVPTVESGYLAEAMDFASQAAGLWVLKRLAVADAPVEGKSAVQAADVLRYCANSTRAKRFLDLAGVKFDGAPLSVRAVAKLLNGESVALTLAGREPRELGLHEVGAKLLYFYVLAALHENVVLKDRPEDWRREPPIAEL